LARLAGPAQTTQRTANLLLATLFATVIAAGIVQTVAHTACCFILKRQLAVDVHYRQPVPSLLLQDKRTL
jgi:hypothetical protein